MGSNYCFSPFLTCGIFACTCCRSHNYVTQYKRTVCHHDMSVHVFFVGRHQLSPVIVTLAGLPRKKCIIIENVEKLSCCHLNICILWDTLLCLLLQQRSEIMNFDLLYFGICSVGTWFVDWPVQWFHKIPCGQSTHPNLRFHCRQNLPGIPNFLKSSIGW